MATVVSSDVQLAPGNKIPGTRISVYEVFYWLANDYDKASTLAILPITPEQYDLALAYIEANRDDVERVHQEIEELHARGNSSEIRAKQVQSHDKFQQMLGWIAASRRMATPSDGVSSTGELGGPDWLRDQIEAFRSWYEHDQARQHRCAS